MQYEPNDYQHGWAIVNSNGYIHLRYAASTRRDAITSMTEHLKGVLKGTNRKERWKELRKGGYRARRIVAFHTDN